MRPPSGTGACRIHHHCVVLMGGGYSGATVGWAKARSAVPTRIWSAQKVRVGTPASPALPTLQNHVFGGGAKKQRRLPSGRLQRQNAPSGEGWVSANGTVSASNR